MSTTSVPAGQMTRPAAARILRRVFSFPVAMASSLAVLAELSVRGRFSDPDMWWHLETGKVIWTSKTVPKMDQFSYTALHHALVPQEWLSQAMMYGVYTLGGYAGLMIWLCVFATALFVTGYILCSLYSGNAKIGLLGAILVWFFSTSGMAMRPQVIGYFLLALELLIVHLGRTRSPRWLLCLPPLFAVWVNCHGSFLLGLIALAVYAACSFSQFQAGAILSERWEARRRRMVLVSLVLSCGAVFLNPAGWRQVWYPLDTMLRQPVNLSFVQEWQPLPLHDARGIGLLCVLALVFLILMVRRREVLHLDELILLAMGAWMALNHRRLVFVFGILAAPIVARLCSDFWDRYNAEQDRPAPNVIFLAIVAIVLYLAFPTRQALARQVADGNPSGAVKYINAHSLTGNMLNDYDYGGYLIWALPNHPVFIDGRADLYEWAGVLKQYRAWSLLQSDPNQLLDKYGIQFCLLNSDAPMARVLPLLPGWKKVYSDKSSVIFLRREAGKP